MITLVALAVVPAQSSEPFILEARNEIVLYPSIEADEPAQFPKADDKPKIGGNQTPLKIYQKAVLPDWDIQPPVWPIKINQYFSQRHKGIDLDANYREPVYAVNDGTIQYADWDSGYGKHIIINHGNNWVSRYAHNDQIFVKVGQFVKHGQIIGSAGTTGFSTGVHSHFELLYNNQWLNPLKYLK